MHRINLIKDPYNSIPCWVFEGIAEKLTNNHLVDGLKQIAKNTFEIEKVFSENLDDNGRFQPSLILQNKYKNIKNFANQKIIVHCGSGVTACHTIMAFAIAKLETPALYIGSWSEWSRRNKPIVKEI